MERMGDKILQSAASWSSGQGKDSQERLESSQKQATEHSDEITDEERLQLARSMSLEVNDNNNISEDRLRRSLESSVEADVDNQTNVKRLQNALATSMMGGNDNDETGFFQTTPFELYGGNETDLERLQRALGI